MERRVGRFESVPVIGYVVSWARRLSLRAGQSNELQRLDPEEINRIARDFGISVSDLLTLAKSDVGVQELLKQRLAEMGLSEQLLQNKHPREFGDLNRVCASCASTKRCANDFLQHKPGHSEYCPNTDTLEALRAAGDANAEPRVAARGN
jgi:hypothetical protein